MSEVIEYLRAPCNRCLRQTNHKVLWQEASGWTEVLDDGEGISIQGGNTYRVLKCAGCDDIRLSHSYWFSENTDADGRPIVDHDYYPPTVTRKAPRWRERRGFPTDVRIWEELNPLFDEVYAAHAVGAFRLAVMGIRALTEKIMVDCVGKMRTFAETVDAFFHAGYVAKVQQDHFKGVLVEAGHAAMHRSFDPSREDVETLLDIVEGLVEVIYYQPMRAGAVGRRLPPDNRPRRAPSKP